jgi:hypothetical protein
MARLPGYCLHVDSVAAAWLLTRTSDAVELGKFFSRDAGLVAGQKHARANKPCRLVAENENGNVDLDWIYGPVPWESIPTAWRVAAAPATKGSEPGH